MYHGPFHCAHSLDERFPIMEEHDDIADLRLRKPIGCSICQKKLLDGIVGSIELDGTYPIKKKTLNIVRVRMQLTMGIAIRLIDRFIWLL